MKMRKRTTGTSDTVRRVTAILVAAMSLTTAACSAEKTKEDTARRLAQHQIDPGGLFDLTYQIEGPVQEEKITLQTGPIIRLRAAVAVKPNGPAAFDRAIAACDKDTRNMPYDELASLARNCRTFLTIDHTLWPLQDREAYEVKAQADEAAAKIRRDATPGRNCAYSADGYPVYSNVPTFTFPGTKPSGEPNCPPLPEEVRQAAARAKANAILGGIVRVWLDQPGGYLTLNFLASCPLIFNEPDFNKCEFRKVG